METFFSIPSKVNKTFHTRNGIHKPFLNHIYKLSINLSRFLTRGVIVEWDNKKFSHLNASARLFIHYIIEILIELSRELLILLRKYQECLDKKFIHTFQELLLLICNLGKMLQKSFPRKILLCYSCSIKES